MENFQLYFKEKAEEEGCATINPILLHLTPIILNNFFKHYAEIYLQEMDAFLTRCRNFIKDFCNKNKQDVKPIQIVFPFLAWDFIIYNRKKKQLYINETHRPVIHLEEKSYNEHEMSVKFPSIFIQGIDAQIVYYFIEHISLFKEIGINIPIWSNHDCFQISAQYAMLLDIILQDIYTNISSDGSTLEKRIK